RDPPRADPTVEGPARPALRPAATLSISGTVSNLLLSPNGRWLWSFNQADGKLTRFDTRSMKKDRDLQLAEGTETVTLSSDGKVLYATPPAAANAAGGRRGAEAQLQVINPLTMEKVKSLTVEADPYDVAASDDGLVYLSGGSGEWTDITV